MSCVKNVINKSLVVTYAVAKKQIVYSSIL